ncbi:hypothetical protein BDW74DRAFT_20849 [Aspergillus multicolor]|uniref:uncharacterized protein n=1 Tax=Aspergillus multicolor TaxID=41759 RepID=UPI003CCCD4A2
MLGRSTDPSLGISTQPIKCNVLLIARRLIKPADRGGRCILLMSRKDTTTKRTLSAAFGPAEIESIPNGLNPRLTMPSASSTIQNSKSQPEIIPDDRERKMPHDTFLLGKIVLSWPKRPGAFGISHKTKESQNGWGPSRRYSLTAEYTCPYPDMSCPCGVSSDWPSAKLGNYEAVRLGTGDHSPRVHTKLEGFLGLRSQQASI